MKCPFCEHERVHKHGKTAKGVERFKCPVCNNTFTTTFDTVYYRRQVSETEVHTILQAHREGVSIRGISRISGRSIGTVTQIVRQTSQKAQMVHNQAVSDLEVSTIAADELWSFVEKNRLIVCPAMIGSATLGLA
jgi:transposase-like protein